MTSVSSRMVAGRPLKERNFGPSNPRTVGRRRVRRHWPSGITHAVAPLPVIARRQRHACRRLRRHPAGVESRRICGCARSGSLRRYRAAAAAGDPRRVFRGIPGAEPAPRDVDRRPALQRPLRGEHRAAMARRCREARARLPRARRARSIRPRCPVRTCCRTRSSSRAREREIEGFRFPQELIPLNQFYSTPNSFAQLGSGRGMQPFKTVKDYDAFLKRVDGFVAWTDQAIVNMRLGIATRLHTAQDPRRAHAAAAAGARGDAGRGVPVLGSDHALSRGLHRGRPRAADRRLPRGDRDEDRAVLPQAARLHARRIPAAVPHERRARCAARRQGLVRVQRAPHHDDGLLRPRRSTRSASTRSSASTAEMAGVMRRVGFEGTLQEFFRLHEHGSAVLLRRHATR